MDLPITIKLLEESGFTYDGAHWKRSYTREHDGAGNYSAVWVVKDSRDPKEMWYFGVTSGDGYNSVAINNIYTYQELRKAWEAITRSPLTL